MESGPENEAGHVLRHLKHVVMVVPVDAYVDKAEDIAQEDGKERPQCREVTAVRDLELQHHDGDDDCEHAVAERFKTSFWHEGPSRQERGRRLTAIRLVVLSTPRRLSAPASKRDRAMATSVSLVPLIALSQRVRQAAHAEARGATRACESSSSPRDEHNKTADWGGRTRTSNFPVNSRAVCQLTYTPMHRNHPPRRERPLGVRRADAQR